MRRLLHGIYYIVGVIVCSIVNIVFSIKDYLLKTNADSILFVAHPDDDTLFFHTTIKEKKPYVVLLLTGWSLRRMPCFLKVMHKYGVRCNVYPTLSNNAYNNPKRRKHVEKHIKKSFKIGNFECCYTHNENGEYGHPSHKMIHEIVTQIIPEHIQLYCPVDQKQIENYPINDIEKKEKEFIFSHYYKTEIFVLNQYSEWVQNEKMEKVL